MKNIILKSLSWFVLISYLTGCTTTEIIEYKADLSDPVKNGKLVVLMKDSTEYELVDYFLKDSLLTAKGTITPKDSLSRPFRGKININNIMKVEGEKTSVEKTILGLGVLGLFLIAYLTYSSVSDDGHTVKVTYVAPSGSGGCK
jgi:Na+-transporting NADH:ubiquinone oxidoreductase subunit NqrC